MSLLLLRSVLGVAMLLEGDCYISEPGPTLATWLLGFFALVSGGFLLVGFLTPLAAAVIGVGAVGGVLSFIPTCDPNVFDSKPALIFGLTMLLTVIGTGPGRFSVDARVFGRREIIIPPPQFHSDASS
jgi:uncharacterized membrane protein YphA (DoxX/SURF4 family)